MNDKKEITAEDKLMERAKTFIANKDGLGTTLVTGHRAIYWEAAAKYYASLKVNEALEDLDNKLQLCYDEIWQTQIYPMSTGGKPKADDIMKKYFPQLKP